MIVLNALATRAGGAAVRIGQVARRAPEIWQQPVTLLRNRELNLDIPPSAACEISGWPALLDRAPAVPRRVFEPLVLRRRLRGGNVRAVLHYGTYVPSGAAQSVLNVLCFISLAPWDPGPDSRSRRNRLLRWLFEHTYERADIVIVQSEATRRILEELYPRLSGRLHVVRNGLSLPALHRPQQTRGFLVLGDVYGYRRIGDVVRAYARLEPALRREHPLTIAGNFGRDAAATADVRDAIEAARLDDVVMTGLVPRNRALSMIAEARAFVSFAAVENGPNAVAEAAAIRARLILSDIPVHREFGGPNACFAEDEAGLAECMRAAAHSADAAGPDSIEALDTWDTHVAELGAVLASAGALNGAR